MIRQSMAVIGATSLVGHYLLPRAQQTGYRVLALSRYAHAVEPGMDWRVFDSSRNRLHEVLDRDVSTLVHLAPLPHFIALNSNLHETSIKRVVALGTTSVIMKNKSKHEFDRRLVADQLHAEENFIDYCASNNIEWTLLRPTMVYDGVRDKNIALMAGFMKRYGVFPLLSKTRGLRQPLHADDLADACMRVVENERTFSHTYNLGGGECLDFEAIARYIFRRLDKTPRFLRLPEGLLRLLLGIARIHPRWRSVSPSAIERLKQDMTIDYSQAANDFGFMPGMFRIVYPRN
ncbi:MAG TPA: NAD(P)-dependent oxidoreductase [Gammaproteobacteria bacterium]|nr:NAD(P)-dependent oxidoreductase [Gammaproteobacteria bacterium]